MRKKYLSKQVLPSMGGAVGGFLFLLLFPLCLAAKGYELIPDPAMRRGVKLLAPKAVNGVGVPIDTLRFDSNRKHPMWNLCSWDFKTQLSGRHPEQTDTYGIAYVDDAFTFARTDEGVFTMRADASRVYEKHRTSGSDPWINFLVETTFDGVDVGKTNSLIFSYQMRVLSCINRMGNAYNTGIHAAQFLAYLHIRNTNRDRQDYGKNLWIGVGSFDNRDTGGAGAGFLSWDIGTSTYIYSMDDKDVFGSVNFNTHRWVKARVDVRKAIGDAVKAMKERGAFTDSEVNDFTVNGMNFGWELPGTFDVVGQFRDFSLQSDVMLPEPRETGMQTIELTAPYTPYVAPVALDFTDMWDIEANIVRQQPAGGTVSLSAVERVPADTPLVLCGTAGTYQVPLLDAERHKPETMEGNMLRVATNPLPAEGRIRSQQPLLTSPTQLSTNSIDTTIDGDGVGLNARGTDAADLSPLIDGERDHVIMFRPDDYGGQRGATAPWHVQCRLPQAEQTLYVVFDQLGGYGTHIGTLHIDASDDGTSFRRQATFAGDEDLALLRQDVTKVVTLDHPYTYVRFIGTDSNWGGDGYGLRELQMYGTVPAYTYLLSETSEGWGFTRYREEDNTEPPAIYLSLGNIPTPAPFYPIAPADDILSSVTAPQPTPRPASQATYNLSGHRLEGIPAQGIYIKQGRKILR